MLLHKKYKTGLVLSGGGARGFAHLGVVKALNEKGIRCDIISGVSAGAIAGAYLASGFRPDQIYDLLASQDIMKISKMQLPKDGLLKLTGLKKYLQNHIPFTDLKDLPIPLMVAVTNLNKARVEYHDRGPLADLVLASASIPVLFSPVMINGDQYVDGGVYDNLPVQPIYHNCKKIIAVNISPVYEEGRFENILKIATRVFHLGVAKSTRQWGEKVDLLIQPPGVEKHDILRTKHIRELFDGAYEFTQKLLTDVIW